MMNTQVETEAYICLSCGASGVKPKGIVVRCEYCGSPISGVKLTATGALAANTAKYDYDVVLMGIDANKVAVIKLVCELTGLSLAKAKAEVEDPPAVIITNISKTDAYNIKAQLEILGAEILIQGGDVVENISLSFEEIVPEFNEFGKPKTLGDYEKGKLKEVLFKVNNVFTKIQPIIDAVPDTESAIEAVNSKIASISGIFNVSKYLAESEKSKFLTAEIAPLNDKLRKTISKRRWIKFLLLILSVALGVPTAGFSLPICLVLFVILLIPTKSIKAQSEILNNAVRKYFESQIPPLETQLNGYMDAIKVFEEKSQLPPFSLIPPDYRDSAVLEVMIHYLNNLEASTWQECVAVWKNDKHREEILAQQEEIRRLTEQTAQNAARTAQNTAATARNSQISAQNSAKIARNTNKIRKSVRTANVISCFDYFTKK